MSRAAAVLAAAVLLLCARPADARAMRLPDPLGLGAGVAAVHVLAEDDPGWDCAERGNHACTPERHPNG